MVDNQTVLPAICGGSQFEENRTFKNLLIHCDTIVHQLVTNLFFFFFLNKEGRSPIMVNRHTSGTRG